MQSSPESLSWTEERGGEGKEGKAQGNRGREGNGEKRRWLWPQLRLLGPFLSVIVLIMAETNTGG